MTQKELQKALDFINKKIEDKYGVKDFFYYGDLDIPDMEDLKKRKFEHFFNKFEDRIRKEAKDPKFINQFRNRVIAKIEEGKNVSVILAHFTKEELNEMVEKHKFPLAKAFKAEVMDENDPKVKEFYQYLKDKMEEKIKKDFVGTYMTYWRNGDPIEVIIKFPFDEVKQYELEVLKIVKRTKKKGLIFSNNTDAKIHLLMNFSSPVLTMENHSASFMSEALEKMKIVDLFTNIENHLFQEISLKQSSLEKSENKAWTEEFYRFREKDLEFIREAQKVLNDFKYENITEGLVIY